MLKARRQHQKTRKLIEGAAKKAKREAKLALAGPAVKKEKVKKVRVKKRKGPDGKSEKGKLTKGGLAAGRNIKYRCRVLARQPLLAGSSGDGVVSQNFFGQMQ
jgi:hypothetical protein